ncbi:MAG: hypothetical protein ACK5U7_09160 [Bacteroidota bacterium]
MQGAALAAGSLSYIGSRLIPFAHRRRHLFRLLLHLIAARLQRFDSRIQPFLQGVRISRKLYVQAIYAAALCHSYRW